MNLMYLLQITNFIANIMNSPNSLTLNQASVITFSPRNQPNQHQANYIFRPNFIRESIIKQGSIYTNKEFLQKNDSIISLHGRTKRQRSKIQQRKSQSKNNISIISEKGSVAQFPVPNQSYSIHQIQLQQSRLKQQFPVPHSPIVKLLEGSRVDNQNQFQRKQQNFIKKDSHSFQAHNAEKTNFNPLIPNKPNITIFHNQRTPFHNIPINTPMLNNAQTFFSPPSHQIKYQKQNQLIQYNHAPVIRFRSSSPTQNHKDLSPPHYNNYKNPVQPNAEFIEQEPPKPKILTKNRGSQSPKSSQMSSKKYTKQPLQQPSLKQFNSNQYFSPKSQVNNNFQQVKSIQTNQFNQFLDQQFSQISQIRQTANQAKTKQIQLDKNEKKVPHNADQNKKIMISKTYKEDLIFTQELERQGYIHHKQYYFRKQQDSQSNSRKIRSDSNLAYNPIVSHQRQKQICKAATFHNNQNKADIKRNKKGLAQNRKTQKHQENNQQSLQLLNINKILPAESPKSTELLSNQNSKTTLRKNVCQKQSNTNKPAERNRSKSSQQKNTKDSKNPKAKDNILNFVGKTKQFSLSEQAIAIQMTKELRLYYDYYLGIKNNESSIDISQGKSSLQKYYISQNN